MTSQEKIAQLKDIVSNSNSVDTIALCYTLIRWLVEEETEATNVAAPSENWKGDDNG